MQQFKLQAWYFDHFDAFVNGEYIGKWKMADVNSIHFGTGKIVVSTKRGNKSIQIGDVCILRHFTGLYDKNGKEIYSGDIVNFRHSTEPEYNLDATAVEWVPQWCRFCIGGNVSLNSKMNLEVIGNIYENPGLLQTA